MASELKIVWDGTVPGLAQHRLSVGSFGIPLQLLLGALRRIASNLVSNAADSAAETGRLANVAKSIDIEIVNVVQGSSGVAAVLSFAEVQPQFEIFGDLPERAATELLDAIDKESKGHPTNAPVRKYLRSLPDGTRRQVYELLEGGQTKKKTEVGEVKLTELPAELPFLRTLEGNIVGVGFEPGRNEVRVRTDAFVSLSITAKAAEVERALELRKEKIRTVTVHASGKLPRLVALKRAADPRFKFDPDSAKKHIFSRWDNVLKRLAK